MQPVGARSEGGGGLLLEPRGGALLGASVAGLLIAQHVLGRATRDALFLSCFPASTLPPVMIAASFASVAIAAGAGRLAAVRGPHRALLALVIANAALLLVLYLVAERSLPTAAVLAYLQVSASGGTLVSSFWAMVNERFDPWTAKRVVGRLGLGASAGGALGGLAAWSMAGRVALPQMLLLVAAVNVACFVLVVRFGEAAGAARSREVDAAPTAPSALQTFRTTPYLRLLALVALLGAATEALLDYVLKARAAAVFTSGTELVGFFAAFHAGVSVLALATLALATRPAIEVLGLAGAVALRPFVVALAAVAGVVDPRLWSAVFGRGGFDVLTSSLFRSGYELLYTPLPDREKRAAKPIVDVGFDKLGALAGGAAALVAVRAMKDPEQGLCLLAGALSLAALALTGRLQRGYVVALAESLRAGKVRLDLKDVIDSSTRLTLTRAPGEWADTTQRGEAARRGGLDPDALHDPLLARIAELRSGDAARIRTALQGGIDAALVSHVVPLLARDELHAEALRALRRAAPRATGQLVDALLDPATEPAVRRRLPRALKASADPRVVDGLLAGLADESLQVRYRCGLALAAITSRALELRVPAPPIYAAARRELDRPPAPGVLEHVLVMLSLVLEREPLGIVASALRGSDEALKGTALEYLENVLPSELSVRLLRFLGVAHSRGRARPVQEVLQDLSQASRGQARNADLKRRAGS